LFFRVQNDLAYCCLKQKILIPLGQVETKAFSNRNKDLVAKGINRIVKMRQISGLYYEPMTIVNDDSRVITKLETSLTDDAGVVIYDPHMFIVQATD
jgi:hypothetical protein